MAIMSPSITVIFNRCIRFSGVCTTPLCIGVKVAFVAPRCGEQLGWRPCLQTAPNKQEPSMLFCSR